MNAITRAITKSKIKPANRKPREQKKESPGECRLDRDLRVMGILFEREFRFYPSRRWKVDFVLHESRHAIEVEGGVMAMGRHQRPEGFIADMEKYNHLTLSGWKLLRFSTQDVISGRAINMILVALGLLPIDVLAKKPLQ